MTISRQVTIVLLPSCRQITLVKELLILGTSLIMTQFVLHHWTVSNIDWKKMSHFIGYCSLFDSRGWASLPLVRPHLVIYLVSYYTEWLRTTVALSCDNPDSIYCPWRHSPLSRKSKQNPRRTQLKNSALFFRCVWRWSRPDRQNSDATSFQTAGRHATRRTSSRLAFRVFTLVIFIANRSELLHISYRPEQGRL